MGEERSSGMSVPPEAPINRGPHEIAAWLQEGVDRMRAKALADHLADPFDHLLGVNQEGVCDAAIEPFGRRLVTALADAQFKLYRVLNRMRIFGVLKFDEMRRYLAIDRTATGSARTEWQRLLQDFERVWIGPEAIQAAPWTWLGINLCCFALPPRYDVFDGPSEIQQQSLWAVATSEGIGPIPPFVYAVRDAVKMAAEQIAKAGESLLNAAGTPEERHRLHALPIPVTPHEEPRVSLCVDIKAVRVFVVVDGQRKEVSAFRNGKLPWKQFCVCLVAGSFTTQDVLMCLTKRKEEDEGETLEEGQRPDQKERRKQQQGYARKFVSSVRNAIRKAGGLPKTFDPFPNDTKTNAYQLAVPVKTTQ